GGVGRVLPPQAPSASARAVAIRGLTELEMRDIGAGPWDWSGAAYRRGPLRPTPPPPTFTAQSGVASCPLAAEAPFPPGQYYLSRRSSFPLFRSRMDTVANATR